MSDHVEVIIISPIRADAETRKVVRGCKVCGADPSDPWLVSPNGVAHSSSGEKDATTDCGKDASGSDWWWGY